MATLRGNTVDPSPSLATPFLLALFVANAMGYLQDRSYEVTLPLQTLSGVQNCLQEPELIDARFHALRPVAGKEYIRRHVNAFGVTCLEGGLKISFGNTNIVDCAVAVAAAGLSSFSLDDDTSECTGYGMAVLGSCVDRGMMVIYSLASSSTTCDQFPSTTGPIATTSEATTKGIDIATANDFSTTSLASSTSAIAFFI